MGKIWNIHNVLGIAIIWFLSSCSTEPEYDAIKTVESENVKVSNDKATGKSKKPSIGNKKTSEDATDGNSNTAANNNQAEENPPIVGEKEATPVDLNFAWDAPAETDIVSYKIYTRTENDTESLLSEVMIGNLNLTAPSFTYDLSDQEQLDWEGQTIYFSIVASNATGDSEKSMEFPVNF
ncbi:MAG: hypothetical protein AB8G05_03820 [Oligoflexales bacterium]